MKTTVKIFFLKAEITHEMINFLRELFKMAEKIMEGFPACSDTLPGLSQRLFAYLYRQKLLSEVDC